MLLKITANLKARNSYYLWRRKWQHAPVFMPGKSHRQKNLMVYSSWGHKELNMTEAAKHAVVTTRVNYMCNVTVTYGCICFL